MCSSSTQRYTKSFHSSVLAEQQDQTENSVFTEDKFDCGVFAVSCWHHPPQLIIFTSCVKSPFKNMLSQVVYEIVYHSFTGFIAEQASVKTTHSHCAVVTDNGSSESIALMILQPERTGL